MLWISFDFYIFAKGSSTTVTIAEAIVQHVLLFVKRHVRHCHGAQAGSFLLEFGMLSVLSGQSRFYNAAKRSLLAFWSASDVSRGQSSTLRYSMGNREIPHKWAFIHMDANGKFICERDIFHCHVYYILLPEDTSG